jgi:hypothetical protein
MAGSDLLKGLGYCGDFGVGPSYRLVTVPVIPVWLVHDKR